MKVTVVPVVNGILWIEVIGEKMEMKKMEKSRDHPDASIIVNGYGEYWRVEETCCHLTFGVKCQSILAWTFDEWITWSQRKGRLYQRLNLKVKSCSRINRRSNLNWSAWKTYHEMTPPQPFRVMLMAVLARINKSPWMRLRTFWFCSITHQDRNYN